MKNVLIFLLLSSYIKVYSQDTLKIRKIDSLVLVINTSNLSIQSDSILQDRPEFGINMKTYLTVALTGTELKKYVSKMSGVRQEKGISQQMNTSSSFYYYQGKLIKVEEFAFVGDNQQSFEWYFSEDKPLYYTLKSDKAEGRANLLLTMANGILTQIQK